MSGDGRRLGVEADDARRVRRQAAELRRMRDDQRRAGILQHVGEPFGRIVGIERQIGAAGLEDGEQRNHHVERAFEAQSHHHLRPDPAAAQMMRQPVGALLQLRIGEARVATHQGGRRGRPRHLRAEQLRNGGRRHRMRRVVPLPQQRVALVRRQDVEPPDRPLRVANHRLQQPNQPRRESLDRRAVEQVGGVFDLPGDRHRRPIAGAPFDKIERQIELGALRMDRMIAGLKTRQRKPGIRRVLQHQHHLEQRMARQRAHRIEHLHQALERQILMAVGRKVGGAHPRNQIPEARVARRVGAQHQRVDEEADQVVERAVGAARDRAADRNVGARPEPRQQGRKAGLQHHEQAGLPLARQPHQARVQLRPDRDQHGVAAIARHRRPRPVARQGDLVGQSRQCGSPERQLTRDRAVGVALVAERRMLPQRIVGILHRQRRQRRFRASAAGRVGVAEIPRQRLERPPVAGDVVEQQQQHVIVRRHREHMRAQRQLADEIEAAGRRRVHRPLERQPADRLHQQPRPRRRGIHNVLARHPARIGEQRAQALVPRHQIAERRLQCRNVQRSLQPQRRRNRIGRARAVQAVQEPQSTLRKRQRDLRRSRLRNQRGPCGRRPVQPAHQTLHGRRLEQAADRYLHAQHGADAADQPRRQQRVAAEREEIVVDADPLEPQHLRIKLAQHLLLRRARAAPHRGADLGRRQRPPIELAVGGQWQRIKRHEGRRHHVVGQGGRHMRAQGRRIDTPIEVGNHIRHQPPVARLVLAGDHRRLRHVGMAR